MSKSLQQETGRDRSEVVARGEKLLKAGDFLAWRQLVGDEAKRAHERLARWREDYEPTAPTDPEDLSSAVDSALDHVAPALMLALLGVCSQREPFVDQRQAFDGLVDVAGWNWAGRVWVLELPMTLAFVFHSLHGAAALSLGDIDSALRLATMPVHSRRNHGWSPLWMNSAMVGWPQTLGGNCAEAWKYLGGAFSRWRWMSDVFASEDHYRESLVAYYLCLNIHELAAFIRREGLEPVMNLLSSAENGSSRIEPSVPLTLMQESVETRTKGFRTLLRADAQLEGTWNRAGVARDAMEKAWPGWMSASQSWVGNVFRWGFREDQLPHRHLFDILAGKSQHHA